MEKAKLRLLATLCLLFVGVVLHAQQGMIVLRNASFEDSPRHSQAPKEWIDCGFPGESEPDIQPSGEFGVTMLPNDGDTYLGMVVRDNSTWERVSQGLRANALKLEKRGRSPSFGKSQCEKTINLRKYNL